MRGEPCTVCGCIDVNLVDGYYYCIECGTQDTNVRETIVEQTMFNDTAVATKSRKIHQAKVEMSPEWYKWHSYNFVLVGLADEVMKLGAEPSFKMKLLWIWTRYIKMFQKKDKDIDEQAKDTEDFYCMDSDSDLSEDDENVVKKKDSPNKANINMVTINVLISLIYVALNIDNSDIQLMDICRFIREDKISYSSSRKYIPKEMKVNLIVGWRSFIRSKGAYPSKNFFRGLIMNVFKKLKIGPQSLPNMRNITTRLLKELCLPDDFKHLVFSLMKAIPWKSMIYPSIALPINRVPDFEGVAVSYIVMALKMCFGLDDNYEIKLCDAVSKINEDNNYAKAYRFDMFSDETNRLFSFKEWIIYLQYRLMTLQQYSLAYASQSNQRWCPDYLVLAQTKCKEWLDETEFKIKDRITMDIINKIGTYNPCFENFKIDFPITMTAMLDHTAKVINRAEDPEIRLLLSEDFSKYSLKYAAIDFNLLDDDGFNIIEGVSDTNKVLLDNINIQKAVLSNFDPNIVYIRDCQNKNWMTTKQPKARHILKGDIDMEDNFDDIMNTSNEKDDTTPQECDHGYNSQDDSDSKDTIVGKLSEDNELCDGNKPSKEDSDTLDDDTTGNIYDDDFLDVNEVEDKSTIELIPLEADNFESFDDKNDIIPETFNSDDIDFIPETFNREETIKELVRKACEKYKIPIPKQYAERVVRKRIVKETNPEAVKVKRRKVTKEEKENSQNEISKWIKNYQQILLDELFNNQVRDLITSKLSGADTPYGQDEPDVLDLRNDSCNQVAFDVADGGENQGDTPGLLYMSQESISDSENILVNKSLLEDVNNNTDNEDSDPLLKTNDPKFDDGVFDPKQLYVKYEHKDVVDETYVDSDPEFEKFLAKVVEERVELVEKETFKKKSGQNELIEEKNVKKLITNKKLGKFGYWLRHYVNRHLTSNGNCPRKFDEELMLNYPKSFYVVLHHCYLLTSSPMLDIYINLVRYERYMLGIHVDYLRNSTNV